MMVPWRESPYYVYDAKDSHWKACYQLFGIVYEFN